MSESIICPYCDGEVDSEDEIIICEVCERDICIYCEENALCEECNQREIEELEELFGSKFYE